MCVTPRAAGNGPRGDGGDGDSLVHRAGPWTLVTRHADEIAVVAVSRGRRPRGQPCRKQSPRVADCSTRLYGPPPLEANTAPRSAYPCADREPAKYSHISCIGSTSRMYASYNRPTRTGSDKSLSATCAVTNDVPTADAAIHQTWQ